MEMAITNIPSCQKSGFIDSEKLCAFAPLREKPLTRDKWIGRCSLFGEIVDGPDDSITHKRRAKIQEQA